MISLTVNGQVYNFPEERDSPPWGSNVTDWATAVTDVLSNISGTGDILLTSFSIANTASAATITGLAFDSSVVQSAIVEYSLYRSTDSAEKVEVGTMYLSYKPTAIEWDIVVVGGNGADVSFSVTSAGQVKYTTLSTLSGSSYAGTIKFRARAFLQ